MEPFGIDLLNLLAANISRWAVWPHLKEDSRPGLETFALQFVPVENTQPVEQILAVCETMPKHTPQGGDHT